jgi:hypothetical protein
LFDVFQLLLDFVDGQVLVLHLVTPRIGYLTSDTPVNGPASRNVFRFY